MNVAPEFFLHLSRRLERASCKNLKATENIPAGYGWDMSALDNSVSEGTCNGYFRICSFYRSDLGYPTDSFPRFAAEIAAELFFLWLMENLLAASR
jgi:hypothetical protein